MARRIVSVFVVMLIVLFALCAETAVSLSEIKDERVVQFLDEYTGGYSVEEFVNLVDDVSNIFFSYDEEYDVYTVYFLYPEGNIAYIDFFPYELFMYYVDIIEIPQEMYARALEFINQANSQYYDYALGTLYLEDGFLGCKHIVLSDGVTDERQWAFWNFFMFEGYAQNSTYAVMQSLGLR